MELSIDQIHTYLRCPAEYQFKYEYKLLEEETNNVKYKRALHKTISYFYFNLMGGRMPTAKQVKDRWATIWQEEKAGQVSSLAGELLEDRKVRRHEREPMDRLVVQGYELVHNFYHYNKDDLGVPIAVDHEFRVPISGITVTGKFELIQETVDKSSPNRFIEIVDFKTGNETTDMFLVNNDLNLTIMSYAFRNLFQAKEDRLTYSYLKTGKQIYTSREEKHFERMKAIVEGVAEGIANKRFYPRQTYACKNCVYQPACDIARF